MNRRRKQILITAIAAALLLLLATKLIHIEPAYRGISLSRALEALGPRIPRSVSKFPNLFKRAPLTREEATEAVQQIGTNGLPIILDMLQAREGGLHIRLRLWLEQHSWTEISLASGRQRQTWAMRGCQILGSLAAQAVPELLTAATIEGTRSDAMTALASIGEPAVSAMLGMLAGKDMALRRWAISGLSQIGPPARTAVPELMKLLTAPVPAERCLAATALGMIGSDAESVVPALISLLDDADIDTRTSAAFSLGRFGSKSKDAVPRLTQWLKSSVAEEQHAAKSALQRINPILVPESSARR